MQVLYYLLFVWCTNVCSSFRHSTHFIPRVYENTLNMGCDYYIDKDLHIYYNNDVIISFVNLEHETGYYLFGSSLDEDEDGYETEFARYIQKTLEPRMEPILIYGNNSFHKLSFENKYKTRIERELNALNKTFNDVSQIVKIETRYER